LKKSLSLSISKRSNVSKVALVFADIL
jgi:hypothetical protein